MEKTYHILNGDALKEQFPNSMEGECIVFRECLVDGPVKAKNLPSFFELRSDFLSGNYPLEGLPSYKDFVVPELNKILGISDVSQVNLWFEEDLFCQVNLWFCIHLLKDKRADLRLVRPDHFSPYSFAAYSHEGLLALYEDRISIKSVVSWNRLWEAFQREDFDTLMNTAKSMHSYPFVVEAVQAHIDRFSQEEQWGRPERSLLQIINDLKTEEFEPVFHEFNAREAIYGFGDLQVKRLFDKILTTLN